MGHYLLEVQRRMGCVVTFMKIYSMLFSFFLQEKEYSIPTDDCGVRGKLGDPAFFSPILAPPLLPNTQDDDFPIPLPPPSVEHASNIRHDRFAQVQLCTALKC